MTMKKSAMEEEANKKKEEDLGLRESNPKAHPPFSANKPPFWERGGAFVSVCTFKPNLFLSFSPSISSSQGNTLSNSSLRKGGWKRHYVRSLTKVYC